MTIGAKVKKGLELGAWRGIVGALRLTQPYSVKTIALWKSLNKSGARIEIHPAHAFFVWFSGAIAGYLIFVR